jgi:hypothetical protein
LLIIAFQITFKNAVNFACITKQRTGSYNLRQFGLPWQCAGTTPRALPGGGGSWLS